jgi:hypothetical protein
MKNRTRESCTSGTVRTKTIKKPDTHAYRLKVSAYAKSLRQKMGFKSGDYMHVVRLEPTRAGAAANCDPAEGCCGCCCC